VSHERRLWLALALNVVIVFTQVGFGAVAHSLGLIADAGHNLTDVVAVGLSLLAVRWARRPPTCRKSFGYHRGTILAAQANAVSILAVTVFIAHEAWGRIAHPQHVHGAIVVWVASLAVVANASAALLLRDKSGDLNMRSALWHMSGDALAALGVVVVGVVIVVTNGWYWLDPVVSLGIGVLISLQAIRLLRDAADVLLESAPKGFDMDKLTAMIEDTDGVEDVHDVHVWSLSTDVLAFSAHVVMEGHPSLEEAQVVGDRVKAAVAERFAIKHATLELECEHCKNDNDADCAMENVIPETPSHAGHNH